MVAFLFGLVDSRQSGPFLRILQAENEPTRKPSQMAVISAHVELMREEGYMAASTAARACGVNPTTVYRWIERGAVSGKRLGRAWFVKVDDLLEMYGECKALQKQIRAAAK